MSKSTKRPANYRLLKKRLNRYHKFSFRTPRKGKDFTPQQKSAITRQVNKLGELIKGLDKKTSFVKYPKGSKLPGVDGIRTNQGIFYKYPGAKAVRQKTKDKRRKKYVIKVKYGQRREIFIPFPEEITFSLELIVEFVEEEMKKYRPEPDYIMWSVNGYRGATPFLPFEFIEGAISGMDYDAGAPKDTTEIRKSLDQLKKERKKSFYNGVFFGWVPGGLKYRDDI